MKCIDAPKGQQCHRDPGHDGPHFVTFTEPLTCDCPPALSPDEIEALQHIRAQMNPRLPWGNPQGHWMHIHNRAIAVLDRLIAAQKASGQ